MFRFTTIDEAAAALEAVNSDYERHCRAAREIAATYFDAEEVVARILSETLGSRPSGMYDPEPPPPSSNEVLGV